MDEDVLNVLWPTSMAEHSGDEIVNGWDEERESLVDDDDWLEVDDE